MVYGKNEYYFSGLDRSDACYFAVKPSNQNGIGRRSVITITIN